MADHHHQQMMASSSSNSFIYPDALSSNPNIPSHLISTFDPNPDIYGLATGIEMIGFSGKEGGSGEAGPSNGGGGSYVDVDESSSSLRTSCVFPCEGHERPSQGLSLSLSSNNPSTLGLQSFELRHQSQNQSQRFMISSSSQNMMMMQFEMMRNSKYLVSTQELLNECCSLGINDEKLKKKEKEKWEIVDGDHHHDDQINDDNHNNGGSSSSLSHQQSNLFGLNLLELQKRKTKLFALLEELDRRYKHYCDQMKEVKASFEGVAGHGTANVYSSSASKAMSRHFRSLREAIVGQIKATKKAMGEKEAVPGTTRGETPRLRILDQTLRQQRAYQQMTMMETHPWRPQRGLPERSVTILRAWLFEHFLHPYPSDVDKHILARQTGLTRSQVSNWFINARVRLWKPMVEQMYLEETKENNIGSSSSELGHEIGTLIQPLNDQKPTPDQLLRVETESLSSIINTATAKPDNPNDQFGRVEAFGSIELDFPFQHHPYGNQNDNNAPQGFGGGGHNSVSLTLGLQQHGGNTGIGLTHGSLFYGRDEIEPVHQYSLLDADQGQNLPYRNLMGAQLLHDFAS